MRRFALLWLLVRLAPAVAGAQVLLRDDFDGPTLNPTRWFVPEGQGTFLGRTQIRPPSPPLTIHGGVIRLQLDTFNPSARVPGDSFLGSEIATVAIYALQDGLTFEARVRFVRPLPAGLVGSLFSYGSRSPPLVRDEIDFELLSTDLVASRQRVLTNVFDDADFAQAGDKAFAEIAEFDRGDFHIYRVDWLPDRVQWYVDGIAVRNESGTVPDDPQNVRLNLWAPDASFADAFDSTLQPADNAGNNQTFFYEVDYVEISRPTRGCLTDAECDDGDACTIDDRCVAATGCRREPLDPTGPAGVRCLATNARAVFEGPPQPACTGRTCQSRVGNQLARVDGLIAKGLGTRKPKQCKRKLTQASKQANKLAKKVGKLTRNGKFDPSDRGLRLRRTLEALRDRAKEFPGRLCGAD